MEFTNQWFSKNRPIAKTKFYINTREVFVRFQPKPGSYMVVPATYHPDRKGRFLLRFFVEKPDLNHHERSSSNKYCISAADSYKSDLRMEEAPHHSNNLFKMPIVDITGKLLTNQQALYELTVVF